MQELWKDVKGFEGLYRISNTGKVLGVKRNKILKNFILNNGRTKRFAVNLTKNGCQSIKHLNRLVYSHFIGGIKGMIDFKDGDCFNCHSDNLIDVHKTFKFKKVHCSRIINTENMKVYDSIVDLSKELGVSENILHHRLNFVRKNGTTYYSNYKIID